MARTAGQTLASMDQLSIRPTDGAINSTGIRPSINCPQSWTELSLSFPVSRAMNSSTRPHTAAGTGRGSAACSTSPTRVKPMIHKN